jgi:2-dehydro-3-deoxygluconokinase
MPDPDVVTLGEALITLAPHRARLLRDTDLLQKSISGAEVNTAIGLARLGCSVMMLGLVGEDPFGDQIRHELMVEGVDVSGLRAVPGRTGIILKERPDDHRAVSRYYRAGSPASNMGMADLDLSFALRAERVHLTGITSGIGSRPRELVRALLVKLRSAQTTVSFDVNMRPALWAPDVARAELHELIPLVDELLCNEDEAAMLVGPADINTTLRKLAALGPTSVVVKRGDAGAAALVDNEMVEVAAVNAPMPVDPVGAGDAFNAGWIFGRVRQLPPRTCLLAGAWVAAHVVQSPHDSAACPRLADWQEFLLTA